MSMKQAGVKSILRAGCHDLSTCPTLLLACPCRGYAPEAQIFPSHQQIRTGPTGSRAKTEQNAKKISFSHCFAIASGRRPVGSDQAVDNAPKFIWCCMASQSLSARTEDHILRTGCYFSHEGGLQSSCFRAQFSLGSNSSSRLLSDRHTTHVR
jgi:hypothetical protein